MEPITTILGFVPIIWSAVSWPFRRAGRAMGITSDPDIQLGSLRLVALEDDPRPGYDSWWHLECMNRQRRGKLASRVTTRDAENCRVHLTFTPVFDGKVIESAGVFLVGDDRPPSEVATLPVDRLMPIPTYLQVPKGAPHPLIDGKSLEAGSYVTGTQFLFHSALVERQRLTGGTYKVTINVEWNKRHFIRQLDIQAQTPTMAPHISQLSTPLPRKRSEVISDGIRWRQTGQISYGGQPGMEALCPEADFAIEIMLKSSYDGELKAIPNADMYQLGVYGRGYGPYLLWCPGLGEHKEHEIRFERSRTWAEAASVAARKLKAQIEIDRSSQQK